ncbi:MAG TPA: glucose 1-dehydrogenase [Stellaceae bacterium]|nr:glucose 1-dehydrogenase [Stellaceae bacterium]
MPALEGKTALVFGASRGIGAAVARLFVAEGALVVLASRDLAALEALAAELQPAAVAVQTDMAVPDQVRRAVTATLERFGRLDIAVNNAGVSPRRTDFAELSEEAFDAAIDVNLRGVFIAMKAEIAAMRATGGGSIVNTGSIASLVGLPQMAAYVASKHALAGLTKSAALDCAKHGIRVNMVAPGTVMTDMLRAGAAATPEGKARLEAATPMGRIASPDEAASAILWLASPAASYVTGTILPVDGGYTVG